MELGESSDSESSDSSQDATMTTDADLGNIDELVVAHSKKVQHVMLRCSDSDHPFWEGVNYRAACGARLPRDYCRFDVQINPEFPVCKHAACHSRWLQVSNSLL